MLNPRIHCKSKSQLDFKTQGFTEFITGRPWAVVPEQSKDTTKGLKVINSVDPCVLKSSFLQYRVVIVPLQLPVTSRQCENVAIFSSNIAW